MVTSQTTPNLLGFLDLSTTHHRVMITINGGDILVNSCLLFAVFFLFGFVVSLVCLVFIVGCGAEHRSAHSRTATDSCSDDDGALVAN